jgi:hypothetical protein
MLVRSLDIRSGKKLHEQIDESIRVHDRLLLILFERNMKRAGSPRKYPKRTIGGAGTPSDLFPVRLVEFEAIRDWVYFDANRQGFGEGDSRVVHLGFGRWKDHDTCKKAFDRLAHDLRTGCPKWGPRDASQR